jgi:hypothetical protein
MLGNEQKSFQALNAVKSLSLAKNGPRRSERSQKYFGKKVKP